MGEYVKATLIVIGALILIGAFTVLWPLTEAMLMLTWPILLVAVAIVIVARYLKSRR